MHDTKPYPHQDVLGLVGGHPDCEDVACLPCCVSWGIAQAVQWRKVEDIDALVENGFDIDLDALLFI